MNQAIEELCSAFQAHKKPKSPPALYLLGMMTSQLENILELPQVNYEYFDLWDKLIRQVNRDLIEKDKIDIKRLAKLLYLTVVSRPVIENDIAMDPILTGCLLMLDTLDELFKSHIEESIPEIYSKDFLLFLLSKGLFSREKVDLDNPEVTYPLCKHDKTRKYAFQLVSQLFGNEGMEKVSEFFSPIIKNGSWRTNKRDKWFISSSRLHKRTTHVGLVNLGCT